MITRFFNWLRLKPLPLFQSLLGAAAVSAMVAISPLVVNVATYVGAFYGLVLFVAGVMNASWTMVLTSLLLGPAVALGIIAMTFAGVFLSGIMLDSFARIGYYAITTIDWVVGTSHNTGDFEFVSNEEAKQYTHVYKRARAL